MMNLEQILKAQDDGRRLNIELGTPVLLQLDGVETHLKTKMVGMEPDHYLILRTPKVSGIQPKLFEGNQVLVRYLSGGTVFAFQSNLLGHIKNPLPLLFLSYPRVVSRHELRRAPRVECHLPSTLRGERGETDAIILDLSRTGVKVTFRTGGGASPTLEVDDQVEVTFQLYESQSQLTIPAIVRNKNQETGRTVAGLEFHSVGAEEGSQIDRFLRELSDFLGDL